MSDARVVEERLSQATHGARRSRGPRYQTRPRLLAAGVAWALAASLPLAGCSDDATGKPSRTAAPPAVPVTAADALEKTVPLQLTAVGNAMPYTSVAVKSQVAGQIVQMHFKEGQDVAKGELPVTIDPRPFEAALRQAEAALVQRQAEVLQAVANLERDTAQLANARVQERRYRELVERELVAREQYDQFRTSLATMESTVQADHAAVVGRHLGLQELRVRVELRRKQEGHIQHGRALGEALADALLLGERIGHGGSENRGHAKARPALHRLALMAWWLAPTSRWRTAMLERMARPNRSSAVASEDT